MLMRLILSQATLQIEKFQPRSFPQLLVLLCACGCMSAVFIPLDKATENVYLRFYIYIFIHRRNDRLIHTYIQLTTRKEK